MRYLLLFTLFLCGCASSSPEDFLPKSPYANVDISNGISRQEAQQISDNYNLMYVGCGGLGDVSDSGDKWLLHGHVGIAGTPVERCYIVKDSGKIVSNIGPSFEAPIKKISKKAEQGAAANP